MSEPFLKTSRESYVISVDFTSRLPSNTTVSSGTVSAQNAATLVTDNTVLSSTTATITGGTLAKVTVQAGTNGNVYLIRFVVTLSNAAVLEEMVEMKVQD